MLITKETDYALRILRALAEERRLTTAEISKNEQVPQQFAYKILKKLEKAGIVMLMRGADGGCVLIKDLADISLLSLMQAMDEDAALSSCMKSGYLCQWCKAHGDTVCKAHITLASIQKNLESELNAHSLKEVLFGP